MAPCSKQTSKRLNTDSSEDESTILEQETYDANDVLKKKMQLGNAKRVQVSLTLKFTVRLGSRVLVLYQEVNRNKSHLSFHACNPLNSEVHAGKEYGIYVTGFTVS